MQISLNTYKPSSYTGLQNKNQQKQPAFKSGYGAEEFDMIDNPNIPTRSNAERWKNIAEAIKMMTVDHYKYVNEIFPKKKPLVFTPEECQRYRDSFYEGTDFEGRDLNELVPPKKEEFDPDEYYSVDYSDY